MYYLLYTFAGDASWTIHCRLGVVAWDSKRKVNTIGCSLYVSIFYSALKLYLKKLMMVTNCDIFWHKAQQYGRYETKWCARSTISQCHCATTSRFDRIKYVTSLLTCSEERDGHYILHTVTCMRVAPSYFLWYTQPGPPAWHQADIESAPSVP
jgi:hypothetical protein